MNFRRMKDKHWLTKLTNCLHENLNLKRLRISFMVQSLAEVEFRQNQMV